MSSTANKPLMQRILQTPRAMAINTLILNSILRPDLRITGVRLGSEYGGWWIPEGILDSSSVCYLIGVGEDASFDIALARKLGRKVWAMDPTPRSIAYAATLPSDLVEFIPVGAWNEDETIRLYSPRNPLHVSHSALNIQGTDTYFDAPMKTIKSLMSDLGHDRLHLLKLDIEGAETRVITQMFSDGIYPEVLCLELDEPGTPLATRDKVRWIRNQGYQLAHVERRNHTLIRRAQ